MNRFVVKKTYILATAGIFVISAIFGCIAGFRPFGIGMDFLNYQFFYNEIQSNDELSFYRYEPGFVYLAVMFKLFSGLGYMYFAAFLMTISLMVKFGALKRLDYPILAIFFYLCVWFPLHENTQIRVAVATSILFLASEKMFQNRWGWFVGLTVIASTFHLTAAVGAAALAAANFLARYRLLYAIPLIGLGGVALSASFTMIMAYATVLQPLLEAGISSTRPNLFSGSNIVTALFLLSFLLSGSVKDHRNRTFFLVTSAGFIVFFAFLPVPVMAQRFKELFLVFMTFIAFEYRITMKTLPQAFFSALLAGWALYSAISFGLFSN